MQSTLGIIPGKWLLRTTVRDSAGQKLTFSRALNRIFSIWLKGMGAGLPIVNPITLHIAYDKLIEEVVASWDH
ncbi:MAG: RDD family protein [Candidatus Aminicenantia bacterium]